MKEIIELKALFLIFDAGNRCRIKVEKDLPFSMAFQYYTGCPKKRYSYLK